MSINNDNMCNTNNSEHRLNVADRKRTERSRKCHNKPSRTKETKQNKRTHTKKAATWHGMGMT